MSKEVDPRHSPPNLVAKLMGSETDSSMQRSQDKVHHRSHSDISMNIWEKHNGLFHRVQSNEFKDIYEVRQQSHKKMTLVRQKFIEAQYQLQHFEQLQCAFEDLNSKKDLFCKGLEEPNSFPSPQFYNIQPVPPHPATKRITILRPRKKVEGNDLSGTGNKDIQQMKMGSFAQLNVLGRSHLESSPPATWKNYEYSPQPTRIVVLKPRLGKMHEDKAVGSPKCQSTKLHAEDCFGDVEDYEKKESRQVAKVITQRMLENCGRNQRDETTSIISNKYVSNVSSFKKSEIIDWADNVSDSEVMQTVSRHSWDDIRRFDGRYSPSSFSGATRSPKLSVCRQAKKHLSERCASSQEQKHIPKASCTLGEMLALSESTKSSVDSNSLPVSELMTYENLANTSDYLMRSKLVPNENIKPKSSKSSFKGKLSGLIFSWNRKTSRVNSIASEIKDELDSFKCVNDDLSPFSLLMRSSSNASFSNLMLKQDMVSAKIVEQNASGASNLIDKSPPIGSISRNLTWEDSCLDAASSLPMKKSSIATGTEEAEERERFFFLKTLLSAAGLQSDCPSGSLLPRLYSPESPLDPLLRNEYIDLKRYNDIMHESKRRQKRSMQHLVFDCVNATLVDIAGTIQHIKATDNPVQNASKATVLDEVWTRMNAFFSKDVKCVSIDFGDNGSGVERVARVEVVDGKEWTRNLRCEIDNLGEEIEGKLLEELMQEAIVEFTGKA